MAQRRVGPRGQGETFSGAASSSRLTAAHCLSRPTCPTPAALPDMGPNFLGGAPHPDTHYPPSPPPQASGMLVPRTALEIRMMLPHSCHPHPAQGPRQLLVLTATSMHRLRGARLPQPGWEQAICDGLGPSTAGYWLALLCYLSPWSPFPVHCHLQ